jgi:peptide/nickel transport system ATP-binding protein
MSERVLEVRGLSTWLRSSGSTVRAVDGLDFSISRGETFALLGESGCGKSMTALSIMRLLPDAGRVVAGTVQLGGTDLLRLPEVAMQAVRGRRAAMIFQEPGSSLNPVMKVGAQIREVLLCHDQAMNPTAARQRAVELLDSVGIPDSARRAEEYPFQMSGGMKQRVMIAMALAGRPELLIADEPSTALDVTIQAQVLDLLRQLQSRHGMAILLITHDLAVVSEMAHRVAVMYAGEIVESAPRELFFAKAAHPYTRKLFESVPTADGRGRPLAVIPGMVPALDTRFTGCRFADRCEHVMQHCRDTLPPLIQLDEGHSVRCHLYASGLPTPARREYKVTNSAMPAARTIAAGARPLLEVRDLKVHFPIRKGLLKRVAGQVYAVDGVSLSIAEGKTLALVGESGCGKTTVGKSILQLIPPTAGSVQFDGQDLGTIGAAELRRRRKDFQIIFQDPYSSLDPRMRVAEIVEEGMRALGTASSSQARQSRVDELLQRVGIPAEAKYRYPHEFSGGQRQRIAIARALAVEPRLLICDEPTSALDVSVQAQVLNLLKQLQAQFGLAYLFITHNMAVVEYLAHEVAVMYLGRIVERGSVEDVLQRPQHPYTQALLSAVPVIDQISRKEVVRLQGDMPSPIEPPAGCHFHPRCLYATEICRITYPAATRLDNEHTVHCHHLKRD